MLPLYDNILSALISFLTTDRILLQFRMCAYNNLHSLTAMIFCSLLQVTQTDRGVLLTREDHKAVGEIAEELQKYCVDAPVKCPLIFGGKFSIRVSS